jgi:hypothetical protein
MQAVFIEIYHAGPGSKSMKLIAPFRSSFCAVTFHQVRQLKGAMTPDLFMSASTHCFPDLFSTGTRYPASDVSSGAGICPPRFSAKFRSRISAAVSPKGRNARRNLNTITTFWSERRSR